MKNFFILSTQRSGSVFFERVLSQHPDIHCYQELLWWQDYAVDNNFFNFWLNKIKQQAIYITPPYQQKAFQEFLHFIYSSRPDTKAIGFDIKYNQLTIIPHQLDYLRQEVGCVIHLVRKNILKTFISLELNKHQVELNRKSHGTKKVPPVKLNIKCGDLLINELVTRKQEIDNIGKILKSCFKYQEIYYEALAIGDSVTISNTVLEQVFQFLEIEDKQFDLATDLRKTNPNRLEDLIENYDEVGLFLEANGWGYLFKDENISIPLNKELKPVQLNHIS